MITLEKQLQTAQNLFLQLALDAAHGDKAKAANSLGISLATLYRKLGPKRSFDNSVLNVLQTGAELSFIPKLDGWRVIISLPNNKTFSKDGTSPELALTNTLKSM